VSKESTLRPADEEARGIARDLLSAARFGALAVVHPASGAPFVTRVALGLAEDGGLISLVSTLSQHTGALQENPNCSLLVGEPGEKGDPLTHARLTVQCAAKFVDKADASYMDLRAHYLLTHPKAKLYIDFADFRFVRFQVKEAFLNGGFGFACELTAADLGQP